MHSTRAPLTLALLTGLLWAGCNCGPKVRKVAPQVQVDAQLGFGAVPVGQTSRHVLKVTNAGAAPLTLRDFAIDNPVFAGPGEPDGGPALPTVTVVAGGSTTVELSYSPTRPAATEAEADRGTLTATTDDPATPRVSVALSGRGTQASFSVEPAALAFGDVEHEPGVPFAPPTRQVTITNIGSAPAKVTAARLEFLGGVDIDPSLDVLADTYEPGHSVTATLSYIPFGLQPLDGRLVLETDYPPQPELSVPVTGRGVAALWQLCRQRLFDDGGEAEPALCVPDPADSPDAGTALSLDLGARDEGAPPALGRLWVQSVGNLPIDINALVTQLPQHNPCPGGPHPSDFTLTHRTPAGAGIDGFGTAALDAGERAELELSYAPHHYCATGSTYPDGGGPASDDIVDALQVLVTRVPPLGSRALVVLVQGHSALPALVTQGQGYSFSGGSDAGTSVDVVLQNAGDRELQVTVAEIRDAQRQPCDPDGGAPECARVSLADNGLPLQVPPASRLPDGGSAPGTASLGTLTVSPGPGGLQAWLHLESDDPHNPSADLPVSVH